MSHVSKLRNSRDTWKQKAVDRGNTMRYQRKELRRLKRERDQYKRQARQASTRAAVPRTGSGASTVDVVWFSLQLFVVVHLSFRAISRVLALLAEPLGLHNVPCPQTVSHWVTRLALVRIRASTGPFESPVVGRYGAGTMWLLDTSIALGDGKILAVFAINLHHDQVACRAPPLAQATCLAICVAPSWTGERIADVLANLIAVTGRPAAYLKDGGSDLAKAVRLLGDHGLASPCISDISHMSANLLKHAYHQHPQFSLFVSACHAISTALPHTIFAGLTPPKVLFKARFMNVHRVVTWAHRLLHHTPSGHAAHDAVLARLQAKLGELPDGHSFIARFLCDAQALLACQTVFKTTGLSPASYHACQPLLETLPAESSIRQGIQAWADQHLAVGRTLGLEQVGLPVTSDTIESLFGIAKQHGIGTVKDANRIALRLPALAGELTPEEVQQVLRLRVKEQHKVLGNLPSLARQRQDILPHPGRLADLAGQDAPPANLVLLPGAKNRINTTITPYISAGYNAETGPPVGFLNAALERLECSGASI